MTGVLRFVTFGVLGSQPVSLWCDNEVCVAVGQGAASMKKVAYVARRVRLLQELEGRVTLLRKVAGTSNPADLLTKHLTKAIFRPYAARIYGCSVDDL